MFYIPSFIKNIIDIHKKELKKEKKIANYRINNIYYNEYNKNRK